MACSAACQGLGIKPNTPRLAARNQRPGPSSILPKASRRTHPSLASPRLMLRAAFPRAIYE
jgi:hypothetical protein